MCKDNEISPYCKIYAFNGTCYFIICIENHKLERINRIHFIREKNNKDQGSE